MPFSVLEAMSYGTIPILSDIGGHKDIIIDHFNGFLFKTTEELTCNLLKANLLDIDGYQWFSSNALATASRLNMLAKKIIKENFVQYE